MYKEKQTRIVAIVIISLLVIAALYYFIPVKTYRNLKQKDITAERIDSLREIIPEEMFNFLTENDSLTICLNSMADFYYDSKDSTVYDTINNGSYTEYEFEWNSNNNNWRILNRYVIQNDSNELFSLYTVENYITYNDSWELTTCDSFFRNKAGEFTKQTSLKGDVESYERYEDDSIKIVIHRSTHYDDTKTVETKDKKTGKIIKKQEFTGISSIDEWTLKELQQYNYDGNVKHIKTFSKDYGREGLRYIGHKIENQLKDNMLIRTGYKIDSSNVELLRDSSIHIKREDKSKFYKHLYFSPEQKLISEDIDSSYYDADSNRYYYRKSAVYPARHGMISNSISDNKGRMKYFKSYHWNNDSSRLNTYERFDYFKPKSNISVRYSIKHEEDKMIRTKESIDIELLIDQYNSCKASLYWDEDDECFNVHGINLIKTNKKGKVIELIDIE